MRVMGCSADMADAITEELAAVTRSGFPAIVWSDGQDLMAFFGEEGDSVDDVARLATKHVGGLSA